MLVILLYIELLYMVVPYHITLLISHTTLIFYARICIHYHAMYVVMSIPWLAVMT